MQYPVERPGQPLAWHLAALIGILAVPLLGLAAIPTWLQVASERGHSETASSLALGVFLGAVVALAALSGGLFLCHKLTVAFRSLSLVAQHIGDGASVAWPRCALREANEIGRALELAARRLNEDADRLKRTNEDLECKVEERTHLLRAAKELSDSARARAEAANEAKSRFLASMSHELRTPLTAISGFAQLLHAAGATLPADRQRRYSQSIKDASELLMRIVDDVLDLARIESGGIDLTLEPLDCLEILSEVYRTLEPLATDRGLILTIDTSASLPLVMADRNRLRQVLLNLGSNAIKYNVEDGWVLLVAHPKPDGRVRFVVRDIGRGIPAERHAEVFTPFRRLGAELGAEEGTGIGLAISRELVHAMGGEIGFESAVGAGSTFWFEIPVAEEAAATPSRSSAMPDGAADADRLTILYIDDKTINIEVVRGMVENTGSLRLVEARTVHEGIETAHSAKPDVVITDIHLPDGKGFDVLRQLREDRNTAHIPVIALTADAMPTNMHNMERAGFDRIVTKPFDVPKFLDIVRGTLQGRRLRRGLGIAGNT